jgi:hypothetical protein
MGKAVTLLNKPNETKNFLPFDGEWVLRDFPILESVAIEEGTAVSPQISSNDVTGKLTKMGVENATGSDFTGILAERIESTDADYATEFKQKKVWVPKSRDSRAYFTVGAGTFTTADVFKTVELHSDSLSLAVDTIGKGARIVEYRTATTGVCSFNLPETEVA